MKKERRKWPRVLTEHLVSYTLFGEQGEPKRMGTARTLNLSKGGIFLETTHSLEASSHLRIKMVSRDHILEARGRVAYSQYLPPDRWRVGVAFTEVPDGDLTIIAQEIEKRRTDEE